MSCLTGRANARRQVITGKKADSLNNTDKTTHKKLMQRAHKKFRIITAQQNMQIIDVNGAPNTTLIYRATHTRNLSKNANTSVSWRRAKRQLKQGNSRQLRTSSA